MLFHFPHLVAVLKSASSESRDYAAEYREYHGKPEQIKARAERNAARRKLGLKPGDGKEADHKNPISNGGSNADRNLRAVKRSTNRKKGAKVGKAGWEEDKHPRADNGQFGSGSGGSSKPSPKKPSKNKRKQERRAEEASQGKVTGAIQTLLSGGSALDNVKWFKQPEAPAAKPTESKPSTQPKQKKPKPSPSAYGIDPKIHYENALDLIESRARHGDIGSNQAEQVGIRSAVYGVKYALNTGRLHGYADTAIRHLTGGQMSKLVEEISQKGIMEGEVPRYLNQKFSAPESKPAEEKKPESKPTAPDKPKEQAQVDLVSAKRVVANNAVSGNEMDFKLTGNLPPGESNARISITGFLTPREREYIQREGFKFENSGGKKYWYHPDEFQASTTDKNKNQLGNFLHSSRLRSLSRNVTVHVDPAN